MDTFLLPEATMLTLFVLSAAFGAVAEAPDPGRLVRASQAPYVEVWTNRDEVFRRGDGVRVYFETDLDAYVTVFRVDTDGRVRVLYPADPWDDNYARGGQRYQVRGLRESDAFRVDDYPGQGYLFAVASVDPFRFSGIAVNNHWDYRVIGASGRITGDPYVALGDLIEQIIPANYLSYGYDVVPYFVEQRYDYPRFLCYDCHAYAAYPYWNPYHTPCLSFRIVVYDDPYYYPARYYRSTRVVYRRPAVRIVVPRYVFKDRVPNQDYVVTVRERPLDDNGRRRVEVGTRGRDLGGVGRVRTPIAQGAAPANGAPRRVEVSPSAPERRVTPQLERRTEPRQVPPRRTEPQQTPPRRAEPQQTPPRRTEPQQTPPRRTEPQQAPPRRTEPQRAPPRRTEPQRSDPPPQRSGSSRGRRTD
jgi:hypothetical protein